YPPMKPAAPVTSTCAMDAPSAVEGRLPGGGRQRRGPPGGEPPAPPAPERVHVPAQVAGKEPAEVEPGLPELAVQPDGGDLRHRQAQPGRLRGQLQPDLEPGAGLDPDRPDEAGVVRLEAVRGVVGAHPRERVQADPRPPRQRPFRRGPPTCWPPGMYREAAATTAPRSTSRVSSSICPGSSQPSAMVTTTTGAAAVSMPNRIALAGPRPYVLSTGRSRGSRAASRRTYGTVVSSGRSWTTRTSAGSRTSASRRPNGPSAAAPSL